ncbi:cellulose biosynthesis cyclic di-GMP-binding regulatory protein BcsB [Gluconacetobacter diazotrophicus]|uniref:Cyclic di-GMP-binding protein n=1 Tax=Gluconacetobacter diazotrophicus (strain ATCC 49037 / DSM 5601 / CCUG 37298 / CIP 103539 / LMG 7603 / PAl5) TaxID=272568 RepID=A9H4R7_GLUDA|nr:cellulose biosynthesis cyclic di-GMP-binding regulatory protein BcsB [Gluconacetobacter diazotrophicus]CAP57473.1 putative exported protein [Gluconacetobacter diazotrophicus PA1 5]
MRKSVIFVNFLAVFCASAHGFSSSSYAQTLTSSLYQQGLTDGVTVLNGTDAASFYIRVPADTPIAGARLRLHMAISPGLLKPSVLQVFVNGQPRDQLSIGDVDESAAERTVTIPLSARDLAAHYLAVRVSPVFVTSANPCENANVGRGYVHVLADSGVSFDTALDGLKSARGFLDMLGGTVRVWAPTPGRDAAQFQAMLAVATYLQAQGRDVTWVDGAGAADIYIGRDEDFTALNLPPLKGGALRLLRGGPGVAPRLLLSASARNMLLLRPWTDLLAADSYAASTGLPGTARTIIPLGSLGVTDSPLPISSNAEWTLSLPVDAMRRQVSSSLHLNMIVPPSLPGNPLLLHVFQNGSLRAVKALPEAGGALTENVPLVESQAATAETLRVQVVRQTSLGECAAPLAPSYVQLLPSSFLQARGITTPSGTLDGFGRTLPDQAAVYLSDDAFRMPARWMSVLAGLANGLGLNPYLLSLRTGAAVPEDGQSFIWLRDDVPAGFSSPVRFDRGRIRVAESNGRVILDAPPLPGIELAAIVRRGNQRGLWLKSGGDDAPFRPLGFSAVAADLAFMDAQGQVSALDTRTADAAATGPDGAAVSYPDYQSWLDRLNSVRLWLFGAAWLVVTVVFLSIMRRLYARRSSKHDS